MDNKVGVSYLYWQKDWHADYFFCIERAAKCGLSLIELFPDALLEMTDLQLNELKSVAKINGIDISIGLGLPDQYDVSSNEESVRNAGVAYFKDVFRMMKKLDSKTIGGLLYGAWGKTLPKGESKEKYIDNAVASILQYLPMAEDFDINYCMESVNRFEQFIVNTAEEGVALCKRLDSPKAKLLLDTFHMNVEEDSMAGAILTAGSYLGHMHLGENNRKTPGTGEMDWDAIFGALKRIRYPHVLSMEPFILAGGEVSSAVSLWRDLSDNADEQKMDELLTNALAFIKSKM